MRAEADISIAFGLIKCIPPQHTLGDPRELHDCVRSVYLLQNLQSCLLTHARTSARIDLAQPRLSTSTYAPWDYLPQSQLDHGILKFTVHLSEAWQMARIYAASVVGPDSPPPWSHQSDYSVVTQRHLEIDSQVPLKYRFSNNSLSDQTPESIHQRRHHWGPYLFLQLLYAIIPCLLNHPFLLSMRLRNYRHTMPQSFMHQSFDLITRHGGWIMYFINLANKNILQLSDPTFAHCVVVIATIHLQHSFVEEPDLRQKSQAGFDKCLQFLDNMSSIWCSASIMVSDTVFDLTTPSLTTGYLKASKLRRLQGSVIMATPGASNAHETSTGRPSLSIDSKLLWDLLVYETAVQDDQTTTHSVFDSSLKRHASTGGSTSHDLKNIEYDLVGSAGISGHKTFPKESPIYAPDDAGTPRPPEVPLPWSFETEFMGGVQDESNYEAMGFQPNDFSRAIDEWINAR